MSDSAPAFKLSNSSTSFSAKSDDIFGSLSVIEKKHEAHQKAHQEDGGDSVLKPDPDDEDSFRPQRTWRSRDDRNNSSRREFARPSRSRGSRGRNRGPHSNRTPDYKMNPDRWTKYSLEDVEGKDMTESSNTRAAFAFLEERRRQREMDADPESFVSANVEETACSRGAIMFVRKKKDKTENVAERTKDTVVDVFGEEESDNLEEEKEEAKPEEKVSFKSKKGKKRNIRTRHSDDEDQNG